MELYKPFPSKAKNKKFSVYVKGDNGKKKLIHFGDTRFEDYRQHKDKSRRDYYLARTKGIKDKDGNLTYNNRNTSNFWSRTYLWGAKD